MMELGVRPGEARALKWESIDQKDRIITICAGFDKGVWKPFPKNREPRSIPYNDKAQAALDKQPVSLSGFVFVNRLGLPLSDSRVRTAWERASKRAGVKIDDFVKSSFV
jgi:integrase